MGGQVPPPPIPGSATYDQNVSDLSRLRLLSQLLFSIRFSICLLILEVVKISLIPLCLVLGVFKTSKRFSQTLKCFNIATACRSIRIIIFPRLINFGSLPKYESNPRRCFALYRSSLGYCMPIVNYNRNATKSKPRQRVAKLAIRQIVE